MGAGRSVYGVGLNDADYSVTLVEKTSTTGVGRSSVTIGQCPIYEAWKGMLRRCYSKKLHAINPTYIGCSVASEWLSFSVFRAWMAKQSWEGSQLDKDILIPGNKVYSPETCVFVSRELNSFMTDSGSARGQLPIGVDWHLGKFRANCNNPFSGAKEHLGYFADPNKAHEAWRARKHELACQYADMQTDPRVAAALRSRYLQELRP